MNDNVNGTTNIIIKTNKDYSTLSIKHIAGFLTNRIGQYFVAIFLKLNIKRLKNIKQEFGIDLGICALATTSTSEAYGLRNEPAELSVV